MKIIFKYIGLVIKGIWKGITFIRLAITNLIFFGLIGLFSIAIYQSSEPDKLSIKPSALVLNLSGPIVEKSSSINAMSSLSSSILGQQLPQENLLFDVVDTIRAAQSDDHISGIVLSLSQMSETSLSKLRYIGKALKEFKSSGKPIFAVGDFYNQSQYYLASYADKVILSPHGGVLLKGYSSNPMYYRDLLNKLDISTHVFRVGTYKSAVEPFLRNNMSEAARQTNLNWLNQLWDAYITDVSQNRHIKASSLRMTQAQFLDQFSHTQGSLAKLAVKLGLVDELLSRPAMRSELASIFGSDHEGSYQRIEYYDYLTSQSNTNPPSSNEIAVVVASGAIMDGHQPANQVGGDDIADQLRQARLDHRVKAVVLRVDSPGGSAFASEVIRNEIEALKEAQKPVVVSMSSLAASGGYWISMSGDSIVANPTTLTGSIGIFSVITTFENALTKLGVHTDGVGTSPFSGDGITSGLSKGAQRAMQMTINNGYRTFISLVAKNRKMGILDVDKIAQGRVWTGKDALENGLVDKLGDFDDAVDIAASLAKINDYDLIWMEEPLPVTQQILTELLSGVKMTIGLDLMGLVPEQLKSTSEQLLSDASMLSNFNDPQGQYSFCLTCQVK